VNGELCRAAAAGEGQKGPRPWPEKGFAVWKTPGAVAGVAVIDVQARSGGTVRWVEIAGA
jgi:hypothetical protein